MRSLVVVATMLVAACANTSERSSTSADFSATPPPATTKRLPARTGEVVIPVGFIAEEEVASRELGQPDVTTTIEAGATLPTLLSPCGGELASDADRVGGRQFVLYCDTLWKSAGLTIYRDMAAASGAVAEVESALQRCAETDVGDRFAGDGGRNRGHSAMSPSLLVASVTGVSQRSLVDSAGCSCAGGDRS